MALMGYKAPKRRASSFGMVPEAEGGKAEPADKPGLMSNAKVGTLNAGLPGGSVPTYTGNYGNIDPQQNIASTGPFGNKYQISPTGGLTTNPNYYSNPFAGAPTGAQVAANPIRYGADPTTTTTTPPPTTTTTTPPATTTPPTTTTTPPNTGGIGDPGTSPIGSGAQPQPTGPGTGGTTPPDDLPEPGNAGGSASGNTTPGSTAGAVPNITNGIPGTSGPLTQQRADDFFNALTQLFLERDRQLGGANGPFGNNFDAQGNLNLPDWLQQGLMAQFNAGANTNATTRQVQGDETVEGRLAKLMRGDNELNTIAQQNAREQAAASGMIGGSTAAAGAALRASREAMLPIAQQDAQWYGQTARDNMDATNRDALSDQEIRSGLLQRDADIRANLYEAASDRTWRSKEANQERVWKSFENNLSYLRSSVDREDQQDFNWATREDDQAWNAWQSGLQRDFDRLMQDDRQDFEGTESERARAQQRTMAYFEMVFGRESMFASVVNGIYSNTNLTPAQQQQAAASARELFTSLWQSFNATLGQGIPNIFANPNQPQPTNP